jgi:hypothetical protein
LHDDHNLKKIGLIFAFKSRHVKLELVRADSGPADDVHHQPSGAAGDGTGAVDLSEAALACRECPARSQARQNSQAKDAPLNDGMQPLH